ncbi:hypothetical protein NDS46_30255 (plasmid) [Paenibacillus thiaminolyticus]|uniref:hypothetical protein n=1 Tax=Paenibacillus thiaminolyticus TaxID=49283 RepID=UPI00232D7282|nr:hypothetical protein [Paenibacillus thiaminolyticus]WCF11631.1 hypothetical protein NDS46_30255 [Paenibacillus thiaminolyticus]
MKFYRLAEEEDFKNYVVDVRFPKEVCDLIASGQFSKGVLLLRERLGIGILDAKRLCDNYSSYLKARADFYNGKAVYTDY